MSEIRCAGSTVSINNNRYNAPFVITAVGKAEDLNYALTMRKGVVDLLTPYIDVKVQVQTTSRCRPMWAPPICALQTEKEGT